MSYVEEEYQRERAARLQAAEGSTIDEPLSAAKKGARWGSANALEGASEKRKINRGLTSRTGTADGSNEKLTASAA